MENGLVGPSCLPGQGGPMRRWLRRRFFAALLFHSTGSQPRGFAADRGVP